jgi:subtilase family serine protease
LRPGQLTQTTFGPLSNPPEVNLGGLGLLDPQGWSSEETLDVEAVHAIAPRARIHYFGALTNLNSTLYLALAQAVDSGAQVVSNSYGSGDDAPMAVDKLLFDSIARQAAARGVTLDFSTGDDGDEVAAEGFRTADFPATSDLVTAVGGTSLKVGRGGRWRGETYWGDQKIPLSHGHWDLGHAEFNGAAGGGVSRSYAEPAWQRGVVPNSLTTDGVPRPGRVEPDLSMVADPTTGFRIGQTMTPSSGGARYVEFRIGGTSLACPLFSGLLALAVELRHGRPLGLVTPTLYHAARTTAGRTRLFHEPDTVTTRGGQSLFANVRPDYADPANTSSKVSVTLRTLGNLGTLHALRGYDDSTGLGTPKAGPLVRRLG